MERFEHSKRSEQKYYEGLYGSTSYRHITKEEIKEALRKMKNGKAVGPDSILVEIWRCLGEKSFKWLTELLNVMLRIAKIPNE